MSKEVDYIEIINNLNEWVNYKQGDDYIINYYGIAKQTVESGLRIQMFMKIWKNT